jgi:hypothetical protein
MPATIVRNPFFLLPRPQVAGGGNQHRFRRYDGIDADLPNRVVCTHDGLPSVLQSEGRNSGYSSAGFPAQAAGGRKLPALAHPQWP